MMKVYHLTVLSLCFLSSCVNHSTSCANSKLSSQFSWQNQAQHSPGGSPLNLPELNTVIDKTQLLEDLAQLAGEHMEGRKPATQGSINAQNYIAHRFQQAGLQSFQGDFRQPFQYGLGKVNRGVNLVAVKPGTDLADRYLVITAHYDHLGKVGGRIYFGADDNASGVSALLAIADYLSDKSTRHSIIFVATDAEEDGLFGAKAFVESPPVEIANLQLNLNIDMIAQGGPGKRLYVAGTRKNCQFKSLIEQVSNAADIDLRIGHEGRQHIRGASMRDPDWRNASDHAPFSALGVPYLYFGVDLHRHYHEHTDNFENIDPVFFTAATESILTVLLNIDGGRR
jgi:hypothetical protein